MSQTESKLATLLTVLPIVSGGLYAMGQAYRQGYLGEYGLEDVLFSESTERVLMSGFFAVFNIGIKPLMYTLLASMSLVVLTVLLTILVASGKGQNLKSSLLARIQKMRSKHAVTTTSTDLVEIPATIYLYSVGAVVAVILFAIMGLASDKSGAALAQKEKLAFKNGRAPIWTLHSSTVPVPIKVRAIACGPTHCAFWQGNAALVIRTEQIDKLDVPSGVR